MIERLDGEGEFAALLRSVRYSSWRWECQAFYEVDMAAVRRWRQGLPATESDEDEDRAWLHYLARLRHGGIPFQRVRVFTEPLTDYTRWMTHVIGPNIDAGEEIRWLVESRAHDFGMPEYDFYLLDEERVAILRFGQGKELLGVDVDEEPGVVKRHLQLRDLVWPVATPHADYLDRKT